MENRYQQKDRERERETKSNKDLCCGLVCLGGGPLWMETEGACRGHKRAVRNPGEESLCARRGVGKKGEGDGGRRKRELISTNNPKSKMRINALYGVFFSVLSSNATPHRHSTHRSVLQQSRKFAGRGRSGGFHRN